MKLVNYLRSTGGTAVSDTGPFRSLTTVLGVLSFSMLLAGCDSDGGTSLSDEITDQIQTDTEQAVVQRFGLSVSRDTNPQSDEATRTEVIDSFNNLSLQLLREHGDAQPEANTINSGYSLAIAMSMLQRASAGVDFTLIQQILGVSAIEEVDFYTAVNAIDLDIESRSNDGLDLRSANSLFIKPDFPLETEFLDVMTTQFDAPVFEADFEAEPVAVKEAINDWASDNTNGLIPNLLSQPLPANSVLALLNATLLDAKWEDEYTDVNDFEFTTADGGVLSVPGFRGESSHQYLRTEEALSVSIEYEGSDVSLMIIMPEDIETYTANLTASKIAQRHADSQSVYMALTVPNWTTKSSIDFSQLPMTSGLAGRALDMSRLSQSGNCCEINTFKQEAMIEVDKDGTRAAAVTIIGVGTTAVRIPEVVNIDQPFLFFVRDEPTDLILFSGSVLNP